MNKNLIRLAAIAALAVVAQADIVKTGVSPAGFLIPGSPAPVGNVPGAGGVFSYNIAVPTPTPAEKALQGGALIGVSYQITIGTYATYNITGSGQYTVSWGLGGLPVPPNPIGQAVSGTDPSGGSFGLNPIPLPSQSAVIGPAAGTTVQQVINLPSVNDSADIAFYDLNGANINFVFTAGSQSGVTGPDTNQSQPNVFQGANVTVTYRFSEIPEPSTYAAGAVLLLGAGVIARRRMMAA